MRAAPLLALLLALLPRALAAQAPPESDGAAIALRSRRIDPMHLPVARAPLVPQRVRLDPELWIAQRGAEHDAESFARALAEAGCEWLAPLPERACLLRASAAALERALALPSLRWLGPYLPSDRLEPELSALAATGEAGAEEGGALELLVQCVAAAEKTALLERHARGGIELVELRGSSACLRLRAPHRALGALAADPSVLWLERASAPESDLEHARVQSGALALELHRGFRGAGLRAAVYEGIDAGHLDFAASALRAAPLAFGCPGISAHGTATFGILFGSGRGNPRARGLCPEASGLWCDPSCDRVARVDRLRELVDPALPYRAVLQTASWGHRRTTRYTAISAELDSALFACDLVATQSQSNAGTRESRPEAWAKNTLSVGAVRHGGNADPADDRWSRGASIGPAEDGRWKPELVGYYDAIETTVPGGYTASFGGSSGATPIVAGAALLAQQMFVEGLFDPRVRRRAGDTFARRARASTVKALLLASAQPYPFRGTQHDLARAHQGFGFPDLARLERHAALALVIDGEQALRERETIDYAVEIGGGVPELRVCLAWREPAALPSAARQLVNDLDLELLDPAGRSWCGNAGLGRGTWSEPGGPRDRVNSVECVFVERPSTGMWTVRVRAAQVEQDAHLATPAWDVAFSLVALGGTYHAKAFERVHDGCVLAPATRASELALSGAPLAGGYLSARLEPPPPLGASAWLGVSSAAERMGTHELPLLLDGARACWLGLDPASTRLFAHGAGELRLALPRDAALAGAELVVQALLLHGGHLATTGTWRVRLAL